MADNFISYQRFTAHPANISDYLPTLPELTRAAGKPDPNPFLSPMAEAREPEVRLALGANGSDKLRLGSPQRPEANPYEGPTPTVALSRTVERKLAGFVGRLHELVQNHPTLDVDTKPLMLDSLRSVDKLREHLAYFNKMSQFVQVRTVAASKG